MNATIFSAPSGPASIAFPSGTTFIGEGNSEITNTSPPAGAGNDWWTQMQALPAFMGKGYHFYNFAITGNVISQVAARYVPDVYPLRPTANGGTGGPMSVLIFEGPNNDVFAGTAPATITAAYNAYCAQAIADGFFVVQVTVVPGGSFIDNRLAVNQNMFVSTATNMVFDRASLLPDNTSPLFYLNDNVHGSTQGNFVTAQAIEQAFITRQRAPVSVGGLAVMTQTSSTGVTNAGNLNIAGMLLASIVQGGEVIAQGPGTCYMVWRDTNGTGQWEATMQDDSGWHLDYFDGSTRHHYMIISSTGVVTFGAMPTSSSGLTAGQVWSNLGILTIV